MYVFIARFVYYPKNHTLCRMSHMFEQSAGGIVYRKHGGLVEVLLLKWKNSGGSIVYTLPK